MVRKRIMETSLIFFRDLFYLHKIQVAFNRKSHLFLAIVLILFSTTFLITLVSAQAQAPAWTPAWVAVIDTSVIHRISANNDTTPKAEQVMPARPVGSEERKSPGPLTAISQFFSSLFRSTTLTPMSASDEWITIFSDDIEGVFPGDWNVFDNDDEYGEYFWAKRDCRPYAGTYSAWVVGGGADGSELSCNSDYPNDVDSWMIYGPFSLEDATQAEFRFMFWLNSEEGWDFLFAGASIDGNSYYGGTISGEQDWGERIFDLTDVYSLGDLTGQTQVWVAIAFQSDYSISYPEGAYVDDVLIRKYVGEEPSPTATTQPIQTPTVTATPQAGGKEAFLPLVLKPEFTGPTPVPSLTPTVTATSEVELPNAGSWTGTTSQARPISFTVETSPSLQIAADTLRIQIRDSCGGVTTTQFMQSYPIINNRFSTGSGGIATVTGNFTSATTATGTFTFSMQHPFEPWRTCTAQGSWSASP